MPHTPELNSLARLSLRGFEQPLFEPVDVLLMTIRTTPIENAPARGERGLSGFNLTKTTTDFDNFGGYAKPHHTRPAARRDARRRRICR
jgi:hypothetical protein